jgi:cytidylate kinase
MTISVSTPIDDQIFRQLYARYQHGELTFRAVAKELGLSVRELYALLEQKKLTI